MDDNIAFWKITRTITYCSSVNDNMDNNIKNAVMALALPEGTKSVKLLHEQL